MTTNSPDRHVVVVGGGVIGMACAYFLMRSGWRATLVEKARIGQGSSHGNCGLICPSHVLPLAEPGMVAKGLKSLFERNSPFAIKPRFDPALWSWLLHFAARCNNRDMIEAGRGIQPLLLSSMSLYHDLIERESLDCEFETRGLLFAYRSQSGMDSYAAGSITMMPTCAPIS
jgi:D-amino-acid dehydrogenase